MPEKTGEMQVLAMEKRGVDATELHVGTAHKF